MSKNPKLTRPNAGEDVEQQEFSFTDDGNAKMVQPLWKTIWQFFMKRSASLVAQTVRNLPAMLEIWVWFLGQKDPLEKEMATHSRILAWRIPRTEEPGGLQSMRSQRVRHSWATNTHSHIIIFCLFYKIIISCILQCVTATDKNDGWWLEMTDQINGSMIAIV